VTQHAAPGLIGMPRPMLRADQMCRHQGLCRGSRDETRQAWGKHLLALPLCLKLWGGCQADLTAQSGGGWSLRAKPLEAKLEKASKSRLLALKATAPRQAGSLLAVVKSGAAAWGCDGRRRGCLRARGRPQVLPQEDAQMPNAEQRRRRGERAASAAAAAKGEQARAGAGRGDAAERRRWQ